MRRAASRFATALGLPCPLSYPFAVLVAPVPLWHITGDLRHRLQRVVITFKVASYAAFSPPSRLRSRHAPSVPLR